MPDKSRWIVRAKSASATPRITLICLAYAGGDPNIFRGWAGGLAADVELLALRLPGHDVRRAEQPYRTWGPLVDDAFAAVAPYLSAPHAFYGHSFGGRLAYELTHRAEDVFPGMTARLFLSGCRAPDRPQPQPLLGTLSDAGLREALREMGGTPPEVLDNPRLMNLMLPVVREEIRLAEQWGDRHGIGVSVPITAFYGREDPRDTREAVSGWREYGAAGTEIVELPGGHFFLHTHREALLALIDARLRGPVDALHVSEDAGRAHRALRPPAVRPSDGTTVPEVFRLRAAEFGDRSAVVHAGRTVDYRTLDLWSDHLAAQLLAADVGPGEIVGVCVRRSPELVAGLLAVLKCGAAYLPFSEKWPDQRLHDVLGQADCAVVLADRAEHLAARLGHVRTVPLHEGAGPVAAADQRPVPPARVPPDAIAYVNFTSGSQGRPKGVPVGHRAVLELVSGAVYARLDQTRRLLHLAPVTFDAATFEIWGALLNGGTCVLYPSEFPRLSELRRVIVEQGVTTVFLTTALFNSIVDEAPQTLDTVDEILTGGEAHSLRHIGKALARYGPDRIVHVYGPTESTTFATWFPVRSLPTDGTSLPIGLPIQNTRAYVAEGKRLCAQGETGELLLAGHGLSPGYLGMPEMTAERFVVREIDGITERLYRTGDLVRIDGEGRLVFEGRADDQVKINGFRIEPGEVAHHLDRDPEIRQSFVCVHDGPAGKALLAFVVPADPRCTAESVRRRLAAALPSYMLPAEIHLCPALPLSPTGKVDRRVLIARSATRRERPRP